MLGEEDSIKSPMTYSTTVTCHSETGELLCFDISNLLKFRKKEVVWDEIAHQIAFKSYRQNCEDID